MLGCISDQSETNYDNLFDLLDPLSMFKRLRRTEDLIPRSTQIFVDPYEKDESSSAGSSEMI